MKIILFNPNKQLTTELEVSGNALPYRATEQARREAFERLQESWQNLPGDWAWPWPTRGIYAQFPVHFFNDEGQCTFTMKGAGQ